MYYKIKALPQGGPAQHADERAPQHGEGQYGTGVPRASGARHTSQEERRDDESDVSELPSLTEGPEVTRTGNTTERPADAAHDQAGRPDASGADAVSRWAADRVARQVAASVWETLPYTRGELRTLVGSVERLLAHYAAVRARAAASGTSAPARPTNAGDSV